MKLYASIAARVCKIWLRFEPDPGQSSDPGTGFLNFSGISQQVMDGFR